MRSQILLSVLAMALTSQACATYKYCACINSDGTTNDPVTENVCVDDVIHDQGYAECSYYSGHIIVNDGISNCKFAQDCITAGAAGGSSCRAKV
ncbi:hypothetical protein LX36DRAFT_659170 [Colletotrichum falcatum]|nr:hypothetical protein LX36DRAFT_659170 [Colletotrichum falcatum]